MKKCNVFCVCFLVLLIVHLKKCLKLVFYTWYLDFLGQKQIISIF